MTSPAPLDEDGNLPYAKIKLGEAISALIDPKPMLYKDITSWVDSLYDQLTDEIPGSQGNSSRVAQSSPPLCIDAAELKAEIDTAVGAWEPKPLIDVSGDPPPLAIIRLQALENRSWRPQDVRAIEQITGNIQAWCESIKALLNPEPKWSLPNSCPACDVAIVYRKNSAGETVRQPALQINGDGCVCQNCRHAWGPQLFQHLAAVLGYPLPPGVLE
jgi:hypothetical protein